MAGSQQLKTHLQFLSTPGFSILDVLPEASLAEKVLSVALSEGGTFSPTVTSLFATLRHRIEDFDVRDVRVVVFGGGTGLSNIIGGDSRRSDWARTPFTGLKEVFGHLASVVCITDDGGSTGELQKDLPLVALGDLRHVLLAAIRQEDLQQRYALDPVNTRRCAAALHALFNYRFTVRPVSAEQLLHDTGTILPHLPLPLLAFLQELIATLFADSRLSPTLDRPQCLGNLLLAAAIYRELDPAMDPEELLIAAESAEEATMRGLAELSQALGVARDAVLPCTTTLSHLQMLYSNGVLVTSEDKSSKARRGYPVDRVIIEFCGAPVLRPEVERQVREADIILFAPGSLYTSVIPILQVPGLAQAIRSNLHALKILVANIWVQKGETDVSRDAPDRKFYVSDLIKAYHLNIPGGVKDLFSHVITLDLTDIPGSILQRYALEEKEPIYIDRERIQEFGFALVEAKVFAEEQLQKRGMVQHDPTALAKAVKTLFALHQVGWLTMPPRKKALPAADSAPSAICRPYMPSCLRYEKVCARLEQLDTIQLGENLHTAAMSDDQRRTLLARLEEIIWRHPDIPLAHLDFICGIMLVEPESWKRCQEWDNIYSFYDPQDRFIKIREDQLDDADHFEMVFLVALGQSLLGNYARRKQMEKLFWEGQLVGRMYRMTLQPPEQLHAYLEPADVDTYLLLSRMHRLEGKEWDYARVVNFKEGFTPPGLFFGLFYTWYLDNSLVTNIEYKMSIMRTTISDLIPEQRRIVGRRRRTIDFFRERVFRQKLPALPPPAA